MHGKADDDVRAAVLLRALEESDREGALLPLDVRREATRKAGGAALEIGAAQGDSASRRAFLAARTDGLASAVDRALPGGARAWAVEDRWPVWIPLVAVVVAFLFGWFAEGIGGERIINLLAFPLLGLIVWNVIVLVVLGVRAVARRVRPAGGRAGGALVAADRPASCGWLVEAVRRFRPGARAAGTEEFAASAAGTGGSPEAAAVGAVRTRFLRLWEPVLHRRAAALLTASFHGAAAMLVFGLVAVMYVKGLAFQYRAGWESTFLDAPAVHRLFSIAFRPASALTGFQIGVPPVEEIAAGEISAGGSGIDAAPWIHLYALTALIFVFVPRGLLAWSAWRQAEGAARLAYLSDAAGWNQYVSRLLRGLRGGGEVVRVQPFAFQPESRSRDALRRFVADEWGGAAMVEILEPAGYADAVDDGEPRELASGAGEDVRDGIVWFSLGSTPEEEVHGEFFRAMRTAMGGGRSVAMLDAAGFRQRMGGLPEFERRLSERCRAWRRVLGPEADLRLLDPGQPGEWSPVGDGGRHADHHPAATPSPTRS